MTLQEFFDQAVGGVIRQGRRSVAENGKCLYRGPNGLKCAVGHCISDDEYDPLWDQDNGMGVWYISREVRYWSDDQVQLAGLLQEAHDDLSDGPYFVKHFHAECKGLAQQFGLVCKSIEEYQNDVARVL